MSLTHSVHDPEHSKDDHYFAHVFSHHCVQRDDQRAKFVMRPVIEDYHTVLT